MYQDHVPVIVYSVPQIPDRVSAIAAGTDEPFPAILAGLRTLERAGVEVVAMPCNTAHAWYDRLAASSDLEIVHMADAVRRRAGSAPETVALLATSGSVRAGFYQRYLSTVERTVLVPSPEIQARIGQASWFAATGRHSRADVVGEWLASRFARGLRLPLRGPVPVASASVDQ